MTRRHTPTRLIVPFIWALASGCATTPIEVPLSAEPPPEPESTLVWLGRGEAERREGEAFVRAPEFDYDFSVEQRRYRDRWVSVKNLRRRHPNYDGSAGPRTQTYFFEVALTPGEGRVGLAVHSSLGDGEGTADPAFRTSTLTLAARVSSLAPFDTYRIEQRYLYEEGRLTETVDLVDHDGGEARVWVRNREEALLFAPARIEGPPAS